MLKINKILNYLIVLSILFLIGKSIYDNNIEKQKLNQPKYEFAMSLERLSTLLHIVTIFSDITASRLLLFISIKMIGSSRWNFALTESRVDILIM